MSKELPSKSNNNEEVDLIVFLNLIGNAFNRFFNFIGTILKSVLKFVVIFLLSFIKRLKWYIIAVALGLIIGHFWDKKINNNYGANLMIETNFNSAHQVYENIRYLNQLAAIDRDSVELSRKLKISVKDAAGLRGFYVRPDLDENVLLKMYSDYKKELDSTSNESVNYEDFKASLKYFTFKRHQIGVASTNRFIYPKLREGFVKAISNNEYLEVLKNSNIKTKNSLLDNLDQAAKETNTLVGEYLNIRKEEAKKYKTSNSGTTLYMGDAEGDGGLIVNEAALINKITEIENKKAELQKEFDENKNVINVLSEFPDAGYIMTEWSDYKRNVLPILLFSIMFIFFLFYDGYKFLIKQQDIINKSK